MPTVVELRKQLKKRGLSTHGLKAQLEQRLATGGASGLPPPEGFYYLVVGVSPGGANKVNVHLHTTWTDLVEGICQELLESLHLTLDYGQSAVLQVAMQGKVSLPVDVLPFVQLHFAATEHSKSFVLPLPPIDSSALDTRHNSLLKKWLNQANADDDNDNELDHERFDEEQAAAETGCHDEFSKLRAVALPVLREECFGGVDAVANMVLDSYLKPSVLLRLDSEGLQKALLHALLPLAIVALPLIFTFPSTTADRRNGRLTIEMETRDFDNDYLNGDQLVAYFTAKSRAGKDVKTSPFYLGVDEGE